jgi:hypothetical protein
MVAKHPAIGHDRDSPRHSSRIHVVDVVSGALWPLALVARVGGCMARHWPPI